MSSDVFTFSATSKELALTAELENNQLTIRPKGHINTNTAAELFDLFESINNNHAVASVLIDAAGLEYISSAGIRVLIIMAKACGTDNVSIVNTSESVRDVLRFTGLSELIAIS